MKALRPILLAIVLVAAVYYLISLRPGELSRVLPVHPGRVELTEAAGPASLNPQEEINISVYRKALPSVVNITATAVAFDFFYGVVPEQGQGSGFIIDKQGHILTNYHVVQNAREVSVTLADKKKYSAVIVGLDRDHDLAVLKISAPDLKPATLGDSHDLQVGQETFAIGNPFGLAGTMTRGIISSIRPVRGPAGNYLDEAIQTDAAINPGNSGGPLLNSHGEVIGINTFIVSQAGQSSGIGFAIPINVAKAVINDLVAYGRVRRPALGVRALPIGPELARQLGLPADNGLLIMSVVPGSAAAKAGLKGGTERALLGNIPILVGGDLIVAIDGHPVEDTQDLAHVLNNHRAGDTVTVTYYRGKEKREVKVTLDLAPDQRVGT
jgi:S1-C subfamily serine protease